MRPRYALPLVLAIAALAGCGKPLPTVVVDDWWNEDFAKEACRSLQVDRDTCEQAQVREVRVFVLELTTQFAALAECSGVHVARFSGPLSVPRATTDAMEGAHWSLSINFITGTRKQRWQMTGPSHSKGVSQGDGEPPAIARTVCAIVKGKGASIAS